MYIPVVYWLRFSLVRHWLLLFHSALGHQGCPFFFTSASGTNRSAPYLAVETGRALQGGQR